MLSSYCLVLLPLLSLSAAQVIFEGTWTDALGGPCGPLTKEPGSSVVWSFSGTYIQIRGPSPADPATIAVALDGAPSPLTASGAGCAAFLYQNMSLPLGSHTLNLTFVGPASNSLSITAFAFGVDSSINLALSSPLPSAPPSSTPAARSSTSAAPPRTSAASSSTLAAHPSAPAARPSTSAAPPSTSDASSSTSDASSSTPDARPSALASRPSTPAAPPRTSAASSSTLAARPSAPAARPSTSAAPPSTSDVSSSTPDAHPSTPAVTPAARPSTPAGPGASNFSSSTPDARSSAVAPRPSTPAARPGASAGPGTSNVSSSTPAVRVSAPAARPSTPAARPSTSTAFSSTPAAHDANTFLRPSYALPSTLPASSSTPAAPPSTLTTSSSTSRGAKAGGALGSAIAIVALLAAAYLYFKAPIPGTSRDFEFFFVFPSPIMFRGKSLQDAQITVVLRPAHLDLTNAKPGRGFNLAGSTSYELVAWKVFMLSTKKEGTYVRLPNDLGFGDVEDSGGRLTNGFFNFAPLRTLVTKTTSAAWKSERFIIPGLGPMVVANNAALEPVDFTLGTYHAKKDKTKDAFYPFVIVRQVLNSQFCVAPQCDELVVNAYITDNIDERQLLVNLLDSTDSYADHPVPEGSSDTQEDPNAAPRPTIEDDDVDDRSPKILSGALIGEKGKGELVSTLKQKTTWHLVDDSQGLRLKIVTDENITETTGLLPITRSKRHDHAWYEMGER